LQPLVPVMVGLYAIRKRVQRSLGDRVGSSGPESEHEGFGPHLPAIWRSLFQTTSTAELSVFSPHSCFVGTQGCRGDKDISCRGLVWIIDWMNRTDISKIMGRPSQAKPKKDTRERSEPMASPKTFEPQPNTL